MIDNEEGNRRGLR